MTKVLLLVLLPFAYHRYIDTVQAFGGGNIRLLEEEIAAALKICSAPSERTQQKRSIHLQSETKIDGATSHDNKYGHIRRSTNDTREKIHVLNATDYDYEGHGTGSGGETFVMDPPSSSYNRNNQSVHNRTKRLNLLYSTKSDANKCLNRCIFENIQVVDTRGIPRENDLWKLIQSTVTSQQSRALLRDQLKACFQELQSEAEDDGCSYANKLERCLMLRIADRKTNNTSA